ncbi:MAG: type II toxin-antitoxin system RelE/ParE family toxin [Pantoea sp. Pent]|nr:type II toxin-antitoxin system RelE/ParE family toxin [Pantoea sp. Pent]
MWQVEATDRFWKWLQAQDEALRLDVLAALKLLAQDGPHLGRPFVDTLMLSRVPNMKELRVQSKGRPIRSFFVFDPRRHAIVLSAGNKQGKNQKRFYQKMLRIAETEYHHHLNAIGETDNENLG